MPLNLFHRPEDLTRITIGGAAKKEFMDADSVTHVRKLVDIYKLLEETQVPNVDALYDYSSSGRPYPYITVTPVGMDAIPLSGSEAFNAVICILQALKVYILSYSPPVISDSHVQVMHSDPCPVYYRDIRQPNILKKYDSNDWFLIDWSDASTTPTQAARH